MSRLPSPGIEAPVLTRVPMLIMGVTFLAKWLVAMGTTVPVSPGQLR